MMERFNFYDVYGYLIPGVVGLLAIALPFFLVLPFDAFSITELTGVLIVGKEWSRSRAAWRQWLDLRPFTTQRG